MPNPRKKCSSDLIFCFVFSSFIINNAHKLHNIVCVYGLKEVNQCQCHCQTIVDSDYYNNAIKNISLIDWTSKC